jgi:hypothetical protein
MSENQHKSTMSQLEHTLDLYLVKKAPALPKNIKEILVRFAPWLVILGIVLALPAIFGVFGLGAMMSSMPYGAAVGAAWGFNVILSTIILIVVLVLEILALPGLFARTRKGWNLIFYSALVSAVSSLLSYNIAAFIIGTLLSLYILFQVREYYK